MRTPYDIDGAAGLKTFCGIVADVLNGNLASFTKQPPSITLSGVSLSAAADIIADYTDGVMIKAVEGGSGYEIGLIFKTADITALADMMMMGDGEAKEDLDDDLKDAISEIGNQFFGGLTVPIDTQLGKKLTFRLDGVTKAEDSFSGTNYISADFLGKFTGDSIFRLYADENFPSLLETESAPASAFGTDFFSESAMPKEDSPHHTHNGNPNMEMLLDIEIPVSVRMGSAKLFLKDILGLGPGNIVELDQNASDSIELTVNDHLIALGEVVIVDGYFGFRIKEIISKAERIKRLKD